MKTHVFMFDRRFEERILSGVKVSTCRPRRSRMPGWRDWMDQRVWEGVPYRSKQRLLGLVAIDLLPSAIEILMAKEGGKVRFLGSVIDLYQSEKELAGFATREGFDSWPDLVDYFVQKKDAIEGAWIAQDLYTWNPESRKS